MAAACVCAGILSACGSLPFLATSTPTATPPPTLTPTPAPALLPDTLWLAADGLTDTVTSATADGTLFTARLPLNTGQQASELSASADGRYLAYLVWDTPDEQHGIASWLLAEPNARLIYQPLSGYRIVSLWIAGDSETLLFVEQEQGLLPEKADWRLQAIPLGGGTPRLIANAESQPDLLPPRPFGQALDGSALFNANTRFDIPSGKPLQADFLVGTDGKLQQASLAEDRVVGNGALSPDGTRLAYTTIPGAVPGQTGAGVNIARALTLSTGEAENFNPPKGMSIASLAWIPDSRGLLLDLVVSGQGGEKAQAWQIVRLGGGGALPPTTPDPARARLFTYLPYGVNGVAYTLFPQSGDTHWQVYLLSNLTADSPPRTITLGEIPEGGGAIRLIRTP